jgi:hypothetical protein
MSTSRNLPSGFNRLSNFPFESYTVFNTLQEIEDYATSNPSAFPGQICSCLNPLSIYMITSNNNVILIKMFEGYLKDETGLDFFVQETASYGSKILLETPL